eukprot:CAMPEP_0172360296 /NCGR_PEP_ID=MMETSP1060-20121228/4355_1 /TAXON_ID=37318 /ORGANISM="Pseudo-nitzschia pungens, Strain cf. cingulata" /LENGTH=696 /DNA_ID=CAMNT_0013082255 /DNA_START=110 /DNA_END=2200 /DNA_ORIENTATION=+
MSISISAASEAYREDWTYDDYGGLYSMQPSDEWEGSRAVSDYYTNDRNDTGIDRYSAPDDETSCNERQHPTPSPSDVEEEQFETASSVPTREESYISNQASSFVDYLSHFTSTFSVEGSRLTKNTPSHTTETFAKTDDLKNKKKQAKVERSGSSHSRCIIENTESIQDRRDEHKQHRNEDKGERGSEEDGLRDQSTMSCSVEEISQISEITMPTVVTEQQQRTFGNCSPTLPTISEGEQFNSAVCASGVRTKAQCSAATDTTKNKSEGNTDIIDFVFDLVEDALCKPMHTSKSERKKAFIEAFYEESDRVVKKTKRSGKEPHRENSKHTRSTSSSKSGSNRTSRSKSASNRTSSTKSASNRQPSRHTPVTCDSTDGSTVDPVDETAPLEASSRSERKTSDSARVKIVDKPPYSSGFRMFDAPHDEELTMDWSKMMSLAEKQLAAEGKSVTSVGEERSVTKEPSVTEEPSVAEEKSVASRYSKASAVSGEVTEKVAIYTKMKGDPSGLPNARSPPKAVLLTEEASPKAVILTEPTNTKSSPTSSISGSNSTHATLAESVVQELRELSALDSSSFEEQSRFLLTTSLFRIIRRMVPLFNRTEEEDEDRAFDEVSEDDESVEVLSTCTSTLLGPHFEPFYDTAALKILRYVAFFAAFFLWPFGIERRAVALKPLPGMAKNRVDIKPASLLQLVSEPDAK